MAKQGIGATRADNYPEWYQQVVRQGDLAEPSPVRGCMIIKPWGYRLWENIQRTLDGMFRATGHQNAYFPLLIPLSYLEKEAEHVEGFAKECAVVTHHRLESDGQGGLRPAGPLDEPLVVRPTSETIIGEAFSRWVQSYRDLPLLLNQWCNVMRWEMRPRLFLRTAEFLWQEGHTAHASEQEAQEETMRMLQVYADFAENWMAMPVIKGKKTESEKFPGAADTYCIEAMMQDRRALQAGTSHFLGQNFAKASNIQFLGKEGTQEYAWTTSWGVSTRLIGGLVMTHSDDDGLILPPRLAPAHVVILPILRKGADSAPVLEYCQSLAKELGDQRYCDDRVEVVMDDRDLRGGEKAWQWIRRGVPVRVEVGPRDVEGGNVTMTLRTEGPKDKKVVSRAELVAQIGATLSDMQQSLVGRARSHAQEHTRTIDDKEAFYEYFKAPKGGQGEHTPVHGGFARTHFGGDKALEDRIKSDLGVTVRCVPLDEEAEAGSCPFTGQPSSQRAIWAKSY